MTVEFQYIRKEVIDGAEQRVEYTLIVWEWEGTITEWSGHKRSNAYKIGRNINGHRELKLLEHFPEQMIARAKVLYPKLHDDLREEF